MQIVVMMMGVEMKWEKQTMFKKDPTKKLKKEFDKKTQEAMQLQRNGKIQEYAKAIAEADKIRQEIEALQAS